ncbi:MBL fold metallo-hydrolase [Desulfogranum japonicum]|uniref:MBL fold metallo-hydrolase n=1 Tax=Desulfogranum japonicum TaxID=231447 RepID=UPI00041935EA|nr:MBL fold metallo-hydrolase [Desulfogranum japonicum]
MAIFMYQAKELFQWLTDKEDITVLDVRNDKDFNRFQVESPYPFTMLNVSYYDFMEIEEESVARVPRNARIRIVCAKEGSAKYVAEILEKHGFADVGYLAGGIKSWGNLLVPKLLEKNDSYTLYQCIRPGKASCSYALLSGQEMMVFDPSRDIDFYMNLAKEHGCSIVKTFETHLQADYIAGSRDITKATGATFYANEGDFAGSKNPYTKLTDGQTFSFSQGKDIVRVLFTPGHTPGSTCYIIDEKYIISGDMIFINSVGRPDLGGKAEEWSGMLYDSIQKVKQLPETLQVLPGHYMEWEEANSDLLFTLPLGQVLARNKNIYDLDNLEDFITFIKDNIRPQPEEYTTIRLVNANLEQPDDEKQEELDLGKNECAASMYAKSQEQKE